MLYCQVIHTHTQLNTCGVSINLQILCSIYQHYWQLQRRMLLMPCFQCWLHTASVLHLKSNQALPHSTSCLDLSSCVSNGASAKRWLSYSFSSYHVHNSLCTWKKVCSTMVLHVDLVHVPDSLYIWNRVCFTKVFYLQEGVTYRESVQWNMLHWLVSQSVFHLERFLLQRFSSAETILYVPEQGVFIWRKAYSHRKVEHSEPLRRFVIDLASGVHMNTPAWNIWITYSTLESKTHGTFREMKVV